MQSGQIENIELDDLQVTQTIENIDALIDLISPLAPNAITGLLAKRHFNDIMSLNNTDVMLYNWKKLLLNLSAEQATAFVEGNGVRLVDSSFMRMLCAIPLPIAAGFMAATNVKLQFLGRSNFLHLMLPEIGHARAQAFFTITERIAMTKSVDDFATLLYYNSREENAVYFPAIMKNAATVLVNPNQFSSLDTTLAIISQVLTLDQFGEFIGFLILSGKINDFYFSLASINYQQELALVNYLTANTKGTFDILQIQKSLDKSQKVFAAYVISIKDKLVEYKPGFFNTDLVIRLLNRYGFEEYVPTYQNSIASKFPLLKIDYYPQHTDTYAGSENLCKIITDQYIEKIIDILSERITAFRDKLIADFKTLSHLTKAQALLNELQQLDDSRNTDLVAKVARISNELYNIALSSNIDVTLKQSIKRHVLQLNTFLACFLTITVGESVVPKLGTDRDAAYKNQFNLMLSEGMQEIFASTTPNVNANAIMRMDAFCEYLTRVEVNETMLKTSEGWNDLKFWSNKSSTVYTLSNLKNEYRELIAEHKTKAIANSFR